MEMPYANGDNDPVYEHSSDDESWEYSDEDSDWDDSDKYETHPAPDGDSDFETPSASVRLNEANQNAILQPDQHVTPNEVNMPSNGSESAPVQAPTMEQVASTPFTGDPAPETSNEKTSSLKDTLDDGERGPVSGPKLNFALSRPGPSWKDALDYDVEPPVSKSNTSPTSTEPSAARASAPRAPLWDSSISEADSPFQTFLKTRMTKQGLPPSYPPKAPSTKDSFSPRAPSPPTWEDIINYNEGFEAYLRSYRPLPPSSDMIPFRKERSNRTVGKPVPDFPYSDIFSPLPFGIQQAPIGSGRVSSNDETLAREELPTKPRASQTRKSPSSYVDEVQKASAGYKTLHIRNEQDMTSKMFREANSCLSQNKPQERKMSSVFPKYMTAIDEYSRRVTEKPNLGPFTDSMWRVDENVKDIERSENKSAQGNAPSNERPDENKSSTEAPKKSDKEAEFWNGLSHMRSIFEDQEKLDAYALWWYEFYLKNQEKKKNDENKSINTTLDDLTALCKKTFEKIEEMCRDSNASLKELKKELSASQDNNSKEKKPDTPGDDSSKQEKQQVRSPDLQQLLLYAFLVSLCTFYMGPEAGKLLLGLFMQARFAVVAVNYFMRY